MTDPKKYTIVFDPHAEADAVAAATYIANDSPGNAERWFDGLKRVIDSLVHFPHRCPVAPESRYLNCELRHRVFKSHRIIFEIRESERIVRILHVRHASMRAMGDSETGK